MLGHVIKSLMSLSLIALSVQLYSHETGKLENITVTADGIAADLSESAQGPQVLSGDLLKQQSGNSLGSLLSNTPGIANSAFGPGVGRPVIRGMSGNRVRILQNGSDSSDVSAMSSDHSPMADASNAQALEVIYGPSTLLYGSGAIGGSINVVDHRIHKQSLDGFNGNISAGLSSVDKGYYSKAVLDAGNGNWILHTDAFHRENKDYRAQVNGRNRRIENSDSRGTGGSIGLSYVEDKKGFLGFALSQTQYDYAIPNADNDAARIKPEQTRYDLHGGLFNLTDNWHQWTLSISYSDYEHEELTDDLVEGYFEKTTLDIKTIAEFSHNNWLAKTGVQYIGKSLDLCHDHTGCNGIKNYHSLPWNGGMGGNFLSVGGYDFVHDTPMPLTETQDIGAFLIQEYVFEYGLLELGIRADHRTISSDPQSIRPSSRQNASYYRDKDFTPVSVNLAGTWIVADEHKLGLSLARAQRAPEAEELFWNGDHHATFSYQLDNPNLSNETAYTIDVSWSYYGAIQSRVNLYHYEFDGYIYNERKAITDPFHNDVVYRHEQRDARFSGIEAAMNIPLSGFMDNWYWDVFADYVNARLKDGSHLPRTPPASAGMALHWQNDNWFFQADTRFIAKQNKLADNEEQTGSYMTINAQAAWFYRDLRVGVKANNLSNETGFNHISMLKNVTPIAGRNIMLDVSWDF